MRRLVKIDSWRDLWSGQLNKNSGSVKPEVQFFRHCPSKWGFTVFISSYYIYPSEGWSSVIYVHPLQEWLIEGWIGCFTLRMTVRQILNGFSCNYRILLLKNRTKFHNSLVLILTVKNWLKWQFLDIRSFKYNYMPLFAFIWLTILIHTLTSKFNSGKMTKENIS